MKRILSFFLLLLISLLLLTSCTHTHKFTGDWHSSDEGHYRVCECGEHSKTEPHIGGTATENERAVCTVCIHEYGELKEPDGDNDNENAPKALTAPLITLGKGGTVAWSAVENATSYLYQINNGELLRTYGLTLTLNDGESVRVKAEDLNGEYLDSEFSQSLTYTAPAALQAPTLVTVDENGRASWTAVEGAVGYVCILNGIELPKITDTGITLADGYTLSVKAVGDGENYLDSGYTAEIAYFVKVSLAVPKVSVDKTGTATWSSVEGATGYLCKVNGIELSKITETSITLKNGDTISVKAIGNAVKYLDSAYSQQITCIIPVTLGTPTVTLDENGRASWTAVEGAVGYVCKINGVEQSKIQATEITLQKGETLSVKAVGDGTAYLDGAFSSSVRYTASSVSSSVVDFSDMLSANGPLTDGCLPSLGTPKVLVIPVNLDNSKKTDKLLSDINTAFNGNSAETGWESVDSYYKKSSYGKLDFDFVVLDEWFTPSKTAYYYDRYSDSDGNDGSSVILDEALAYYDGRIDFSDYDNNDDGYIDSVWLIYNCDVDYESYDSIYWAFQSWSYSEETYDGVGVCYYAFAGTDFMYDRDTMYDSENIKIDAHTYIHETGHLMGLDDYYDYDESVGAVGGFYTADMMDSNIGDHSSINKLLLNWIDPTVLSGEGEIELTLTSFTETGFAVLIANHALDSVYDEYFLIEFYTGTGLNANDQPVYDGESNNVYGIRILHVDANIFYNSYGEIDLNGGSAYETGFKYDNSDEDKLFVDTMCMTEPDDFYATEEILFTPDSDDFGIDVYASYKYHDGTALNFTLEVLEMNEDSATVVITLK